MVLFGLLFNIGILLARPDLPPPKWSRTRPCNGNTLLITLSRVVCNSGSTTARCSPLERQGTVAQAACPFRARQHHPAHAEGESHPSFSPQKVRQPAPSRGRCFRHDIRRRQRRGSDIRPQDPFDNFDDDVVRHPQMREWVAGQDVHAEFQHEHIRCKRAGEWHDDRVKRGQKRLIVGFRR